VRVAFVHDYLTQYGGAERVLLAMHPLFGDAPIYTSVVDRGAFGGALDGIDVRATWLDRVPGARRHFRAMLPLYPSAFESIDLRGFDLVISSTTSFAKGVRTPPATMHVCYMNTPTRFLWDVARRAKLGDDEYAGAIVPPLARPLFAAMVPALRRWDLAASRRPFRIIANSANVAARIREIYRRESDVLHCAVDVDAFSPEDGEGDHYLVASRLLPYKRVGLAIEACRAIGAPLVIIGAGPDERRLRALAGDGVRFAGSVTDAVRASLFARARAVIVPGVEDFGLVAIEAAASGRPTVAYGAGGSLETVVEGRTGVFFREPDAASLADALRAASAIRFDRAALVAHARSFSPERFRAGLAALLDRYFTEFDHR
jgi:glycosyltransferase involved in cell wall biosynthesis